MFKKLRIQFIGIVMASVAIVLTITFVGICVTDYQRSLAQVNQALSNALDQVVVPEGAMTHGPLEGEQPENGIIPNEFDDMGVHGKMGPGREGRPNVGGTASEGFMAQRIGGKGDGRGQDLIAVAVYTVSDDGSLVASSNFTRASLSADVLSEAAQLVQSAKDDMGTFDSVGLHYARRTVDGVTYLAFADTANTSNWQSLALTLVIAGLAVLAAFFVISLFLSNWALKPVRDAWDSQRQFVADASHELKTPLTVILANASILLKHPQDTIASQSKWVESTQTEAESMQQLVSEMLELARVEERAAIVHEPFDLSDLVDGITLTFESVAFEQGCTFNSEIEEGLSIDGDKSRIAKMTSTLIENALKYVDEGGTVEVKLAKTGSSAQLVIHNTGSCIASEDLPHIFDRFYRTDKARTSGTGGFGLGLAIARGIAREHEGDIVCDSSPQTGTVFTVTLPLR